MESNTVSKNFSTSKFSDEALVTKAQVNLFGCNKLIAINYLSFSLTPLAYSKLALSMT